MPREWNFYLGLFGQVMVCKASKNFSLIYKNEKSFALFKKSDVKLAFCPPLLHTPEQKGPPPVGGPPAVSATH
jgi:hypothetical protein